MLVELIALAAVHRPHHVSRSEQREPLKAAHDWSGVGQCESSGDPHANTGNGYYGYLQEDAAFWANYGGLAFALRPDLATKAEQIAVAERGLKVQGIGSWPVCGVYLRGAA